MAVSFGFAVFLAVVQVVLGVLYGLFTYYDRVTFTNLEFTAFTEIHMMVLMGFALLMTFLYKNSYTAMGHTLMIAAVATLWSILNEGFWHQALDPIADHRWTKLPLALPIFVKADFCAAAVLISFGAVLGRASATQLLIMALFEVVVYSINEALAVKVMIVSDLGGSMIIHMFGAFFGLAVSFVLSRRRDTKARDCSAQVGSHRSDSLSMFGTLLLWVFWPTFNSYFAHSNQNGATRAVVNTYLSLAASVVATYFMCVIVFRGYFRITEIQNATLAGGVAMGAAADMMMEPYGAILVGLAAGCISVLSFRYVTPMLASLGLQDTCGVLSLHGLPAAFGAFVAVGSSGIFGEASDYTSAADFAAVFPDRQFRSQESQAWHQFAFIFITLGMALVGGLISGVVMVLFPTLERFYDDDAEWLLPRDVLASEGHDEAGEPAAQA